MSTVNITANINSIPMLNDSNFKSWLENLSIVLAVMDLDLALRVDSLQPLTNESIPDDKKEIDRWERSNCMCIMIMKKVILEAFRGSTTEKATAAKKFLTQIEHRFLRTKRLKLVRS